MKKLFAAALLFDMDGTIVDSNATVEAAWAVWAQRHHLNLAEVLHYSHGRPTLDTMEHFGPRLMPGKDWQAEADEMQQMETEMGGAVAVPGALSLLNRLPSERWAVVTSAPRQLAEDRIEQAGLPLPRVLVPVDEISKGKPHPEGYLTAARLLGVEPGECVVFEDTPPGVEAGLRAGMQVIGLLTTVEAERLGTKNVIADYRDLRVMDAGGRFELSF